MRHRRRAAILLGPIAVLLTATLLFADPPAELGVTDPDAKQVVESALKSGFVSVYPVRNVLKAASPEARAKLVEGTLAWARAYAESPEFAAAWAKARESAKPTFEEAKVSIDEELAQQRKERAKQVEEMKKTIASMPADQQAMMQDAVKAMIETNKQLDSDPAMVDIQKQGLEMQRAQEKQQYEEAMKRWEETFPADPRAAIARRLRAFLSTCADVDFGAELVTQNNRSKFANPAYETKSGEWKLCYRAGEPAVTAARDFANAWLKELPK